MPAEPILFTRGIKSANVETGGGGREGGRGWGWGMTRRVEVPQRAHPRYRYEDERLVSKGKRKEERTGAEQLADK